MYRQAHAQLDDMRIPLLFDSKAPHQRLYVAAMDGTGNSMYDDRPEHWSVVAKIYRQIEDAKPANVASGYVEGTFTQDGMRRLPSKLIDGRFAHTFDERVETAYYQLCMQAKKWLEEEPNAQIRVMGVGFSRGAESIAALQRLVEERGIRDPLAAEVQRDREGLVTRISYADAPPLVPPGKTLQAALLYDPVQTGVEDEHRCLMPSTVSTLQISARDEKRNLFRASDHVPVGFSEDHRNLNLILPGAHSDKGDTYVERGLGTLSFNLGVAFINRSSDVPILKPQALPQDPSQYVIHRSETGMFGLYRTSGFDRDGLRDRVDDCSPEPGTQRKQPISPELESQIQRRTGRDFGTSPDPAVSPAMPGVSLAPADAVLDRALAAYGQDGRAFSQVMSEYRQTPAGQAWEQQQSEHVRALREQAAQEPATREQPMPGAPVHRAHALRM
ncbi:MAG: phospholipase effector Tle1 domain-containing protein [Pseudomonadota bacterium]